MATIIIPPKKSLLTLLSALFMLVAFTACSSSEGNNSDEPERPQPETPVNNDDWQTVPASGGTIEKGDISITFPSGTFASDTKVAISEAQKGETCGENEVSIFYQITLPVTTNKAFSLKIKCEEKADDIYFVVRSPGFALSEQTAQYHNYSLEGNYNNGEYSVSIPEADNGSSGETCNFTIGLAHVMREPGGNMTRADHTIKWHFDSSNWTLLWTTQAQLDKLGQLKPFITRYINDALAKIQELGFKINEDRDIPIIFKIGLGKKYGAFCQDWRKDKNSTIELNQDKILAMGDDHTDLKTTIIHELLHYFQSEYDYRTPYDKAGQGKDDLIMYESGAVWAEQFMNDGYLNYEFIRQYIYEFSRSLTEVETVYSEDPQVAGTYKMYQDHGYGMSTLLTYLAKQTWADFNNTSIVELYQIWHDTKMKSLSCLSAWLDSHHYGLLDGCQYDDYMLELAQGNIPAKVGNLDADVLAKTSSGRLKGVGSITTREEICYPYGSSCKKIEIMLPKEENLANKQLIVRQDNEGVQTYAYIKSTKGTKLYKTPATLDKPFAIKMSDLEIHKDDEGQLKIILYLISTNQDNARSLQSSATAEIAEASETTIKSVKFHAGIDLLWENHVDPYGESFDYYSTNNNCTLNGNTLHVECGPNEADVSPGGAGGPNFDSGGDFLSFDIVGVNSDSKEWRIENLIHKYGRRRINLPSTDISSDIYLVAYNSDLQLTNMVMSESLSKGPSKLVFIDWDKYGFEVTNAYVERIFSDDSKWVYHFNKVSGGVKLTLDTTP